MVCYTTCPRSLLTKLTNIRALFSDRSNQEETERSLRALIKLAANPECVSSLVEGLGNYMKLVLALTEQADAPNVERAISQLFNTITQVNYLPLSRCSPVHH